MNKYYLYATLLTKEAANVISTHLLNKGFIVGALSKNGNLTLDSEYSCFLSLVISSHSKEFDLTALATYLQENKISYHSLLKVDLNSYLNFQWLGGYFSKQSKED